MVNIDLMNPYLAEELCEFVLGDELTYMDFCEARSQFEDGLSVLEYVAQFRRKDFVLYLQERGYDLQQFVDKNR